MPLSSTDMIQSFRLRFWREQRLGGPADWRGDVWHEQQEPGEGAVVVANPEAAFELVRQTLQLCSGTHDADAGATARTGQNEFNHASCEEPQRQRHALRSIWRRIRGPSTRA